MDCSYSRRLLALWMERDVSRNDAVVELELHLATCRECARVAERLKGSMAALHQAADADVAPDDRVWSRVSKRLGPMRRPLTLRARLRGWAPAVSLAACAMIVCTTLGQIAFTGAGGARQRDLFATDADFAHQQGDGRHAAANRPAEPPVHHAASERATRRSILPWRLIRSTDW